MNIPNTLTLFRIICTPVLVVILLSQFEGREITAFIIYIMANLSDIADGVWARRKKQTTVLGSFLDPIADKILSSSVLICFVGLGVVPSWIVIIIICREIAVTGFRAIASSRGIIIPSFFLGKIKMTIMSVTINFLLLGKAILGKIYILSQVGLWLSMIVSVISALELLIRFGRSVLSEEI